MPKRKSRNQSLKQRVKTLEMRLQGQGRVEVASIKVENDSWLMKADGTIVVDSAQLKASAQIGPFEGLQKSLSQEQLAAVARGSFC
ncbi:hypothetical protein [Comamonas kerstersii]|uniref:hypothetical protein n=1 Tax=Comamonas kerstersii TaxID=225992 RepID=UPI0026701177|nr:hypothetical protein [Comamonas kerstersii]